MCLLFNYNIAFNILNFNYRDITMYFYMTDEKVIKLSSLNIVIEKHKRLLNNMKDNLSKHEEEQWTESEIKECKSMIKTLAYILSDLNSLI